MARLDCWSCLLIILVAVGWARAGESHRESLLLRPLFDGKLMVRFEFTTTTTTEASFHYDLLPLNLGLIVAKHDVQELRVSLGNGRWRAERWGLPPANTAAPAGLVVWARFASQNGTTPDAAAVDAQWRGLLHALGGLLCASLGFVATGSTHTVVLAPDQRYGTLPREAVCTENLTPWLNLLPCRDAVGFGAVIAPGTVFDSDHHAMSLSFVRGADGSSTLTQRLLYVTAATASHWNNRNAFGAAGNKPLLGCHIAAASTVHVDLSMRGDASGATRAGVHEVGRTTPFELDIRLQQPRSKVASDSAVNIYRHMAGMGQEKGSVVTVITTSSGAGTQMLLFTEIVPCYLRVFHHTLRVSVDGVALHPPPIVKLHPSSVGRAPSLLQLHLHIPANGTAKIVWHYRKAFLMIAEHPPDAHHGFHLPASFVSDAHTGDVLLYSDVLVAMMPLPDFSMPFNVVAITGVMLGFYWGAMLRAVTTRYSELKRHNMAVLESQRPIARLARLLLRLVDGR